MLQYFHILLTVSKLSSLAQIGQLYTNVHCNSAIHVTITIQIQNNYSEHGLLKLLTNILPERVIQYNIVVDFDSSPLRPGSD